MATDPSIYRRLAELEAEVARLRHTPITVTPPLFIENLAGAGANISWIDDPTVDNGEGPTIQLVDGVAYVTEWGTYFDAWLLERINTP